MPALPALPALPRPARLPRHGSAPAVALLCLVLLVCPATARTPAQAEAQPLGRTPASTAVRPGTLASAGAAGPAVLQARIEDGLRRGEAASVLPLAAAAAAEHPQHAALQFLHGVALMDLARDEQALQVFTRFTHTWPELPDPLNNIALLHARAGRLDAALQALQEALRADPAHHAARINLGHVHLALAVRAWETAAATAALEPSLAQRLLAARALLRAPGR